MKPKHKTPPEILAYAVVQWVRDAEIGIYWGRTREERELLGRELRAEFELLPEDTQAKYISAAWDAHTPWYKQLWSDVKGLATNKDKQELRKLLKDYPTAWATDELIRQIKEKAQ